VPRPARALLQAAQPERLPPPVLLARPALRQVELRVQVEGVELEHPARAPAR
jgi:hypothetical protein